MTASFQRPEAGLEHQVGEVRSPAPEELPPPEEMLPPGENLDWIQSLEEMSGFEFRFPEPPARSRAAGGAAGEPQTEEHTSELQSLMRISYAVFCLTKKTTTQQHDRQQIIK